MQRSQSLGFTLLELLVTLAIIGILAAIAIPQYIGYMRRAYFSEVIQAAGALTEPVTFCAQKLGTLTGCNGGTNGIPPNMNAFGLVNTLTVTNGTISVVPNSLYGIQATDTYIMQPTFDQTNVRTTWAIDPSSGCLSDGLC